MKYYHYIFYRIYRRHNHKYSKIESAYFATIMLSCLGFLNLVTIGVFFERINLIKFMFNSKWQAIIIIILLVIINLLIFMREKKFLEIENNFKTIINKKNSIGTMLIISYFVLSFIIFFIVLSL